MQPLKYCADLRSLPDEEYSRVYTLLNHAMETEALHTSKPKVFCFFMDEKDFARLSSQLPLSLIHRVP